MVQGKNGVALGFHFISRKSSFWVKGISRFVAVDSGADNYVGGKLKIGSLIKPVTLVCILCTVKYSRIKCIASIVLRIFMAPPAV